MHKKKHTYNTRKPSIFFNGKKKQNRQRWDTPKLNEKSWFFTNVYEGYT